MLHQFGHVLGLSHTNRVTSVMAPFYYEWIAESELRPDHIDIDMASASPSSKYNDHSIVVFSLIIIMSLLQ